MVVGHRHVGARVCLVTGVVLTVYVKWSKHAENWELRTLNALMPSVRRNWRRNPAEIDGIFRLLNLYLKKEVTEA